MLLKRKIVLFSLFICSILVFFSCKESSDVVSGDSSLRLTFSSDTIRFDTVFSTVNSATRRVLVHNLNKNALDIASVDLMGGSNSYFRINVDGYSGNQQHLEIRGRDSLYVFIELTVDPQNQNNPVLIEDSIRFVINGQAQYLYLEAYGQDVYIWKNKRISQDTVLDNSKPYLIYDSLSVSKNAKLSILPGVKFYFHKNAGLYLHGQLQAEGTVDNPIVFRGDRTDNIFTDVPYDVGVAGQWNGIFVDSLSYGNTLKNVRIRNGIYGLNFRASLPDVLKANLENVVVHNVLADAVSAVNCNINFGNCQITNAKEMALRLVGGKYTLLHCTLANYFNAVGEYRASDSKTLYLSNILGKEVLPLSSCDLINCIISGAGTSEVQLSNTLNGQAQTPFEYLFKNCLINLQGTDDDNFVGTIWNKSPVFLNLNTGKNYLYNFELDSTSAAIDKADRSYSLDLPFDLHGVSRLNDTNPDIGCYEWHK